MEYSTEFIKHRMREPGRDGLLEARQTFKTEVYGKCILTGEHAVLRGIPALVVPLKSRSLQLIYLPHNKSNETVLKIESYDEASEPTKLVLWGVIEKALSHVNKNFSDMTGTLRVKNDIPFGAGLGASAALCVSIARLFSFLGWIHSEAVVEFARTLEDIFHGESSGVDVAVSQSGDAIEFTRGQRTEKLNIQWQPNLFLSFSGRKGVTSECVRAVQSLIKQDEVKGLKTDKKMQASVEFMKKALTSDRLSHSERQKLLIDSMNSASECFEGWGLTKGYLCEHMNYLKSSGALAVKPTGSGGGGHVISLWSDLPPQLSGVEFLKLDV